MIVAWSFCDRSLLFVSAAFTGSIYFTFSILLIADADQQTTTGWQGVFRIASYSPYFNVDTDVVVDRIISSVYPMNDFYRKIDDSPDL